MPRATRRLVPPILAIGLLLASGPAAEAQRWFDSYERGMRALEKGRGEEAVDQLERALRKRGEPGDNVLTYGTNRIDYHPYLRLAEAHLLLGDPVAAREALARSESLGKEPADDRARLLGRVETAAREAARAATTPEPAPPTTQARAAPKPAATVTPSPVATPQPTAPPTPNVTPPAAPRAKRPGRLEVASEPTGAVVEIDGRERGRTPLSLSLAAGDHAVALAMEGWRRQTFMVRVVAGQTTSRSFELVSLPSSPGVAPTPALAGIEVFSQPPGAMVYLDDEHIGRTDPQSGRLVRRNVVAGDHHLRLTLDGHEQAVSSVSVAEKGLNRYDVTLTPVPAAPRAWPLGLLGLLILALVIVAWLAFRRRAPAPVDEEAPTAALPQTPGTPPRSPTPGSSGGRLTMDPFATRASEPLPPPSASDEWFGDFRLLELLGRGGMASVYKVQRGDELLALKRPLESFLEEPEFVQRFLREAEIGRTLHHPNIIRIFERGEVNAVPFFTMELVVGETLQSFVRRNGALGPRAATKVVVQVAEALDYAHLKGVVHRDLKPSNIMILDEGTVKVMDYGIARSQRWGGLTMTGAFLGTPDYVSPETAEGRGADARSDLYSLGVIYYETLTGEKPFVGETPFATLKKHCSEAPTPPSAIRATCPRELETVVLRLLEKAPEKRYPTAEELLIELRDYLNRVA